jgi:hypothetical protein
MGRTVFLFLPVSFSCSLLYFVRFLRIMAEPTRNILSESICLITTKCASPVSYTYEVENTALKNVAFTLDFTGTENFAIDGSSDMTMKADLKPFSRTTLGTITRVDKYKPASLSMGMEWITSEASEEDTAKYFESVTLLMQPLLNEASKLPFPPSDIDATDEQCLAVCRTYGKKFIDKDFLPSVTSLFRKSTKLSPGEMSGREVTKRTAIEWKRASEFMEGEYFVFEGGIEAADIQQGQTPANYTLNVHF